MASQIQNDDCNLYSKGYSYLVSLQSNTSVFGTENPSSPYWHDIDLLPATEAHFPTKGCDKGPWPKESSRRDLPPPPERLQADQGSYDMTLQEQDNLWNTYSSPYLPQDPHQSNMCECRHAGGRSLCFKTIKQHLHQIDLPFRKAYFPIKKCDQRLRFDESSRRCVHSLPERRPAYGLDQDESRQKEISFPNRVHNMFGKLNRNVSEYIHAKVRSCPFKRTNQHLHKPSPPPPPKAYTQIKHDDESSGFNTSSQRRAPPLRPERGPSDELGQNILSWRLSQRPVINSGILHRKRTLSLSDRVQHAIKTLEERVKNICSVIQIGWGSLMDRLDDMRYDGLVYKRYYEDRL